MVTLVGGFPPLNNKLPKSLQSAAFTVVLSYKMLVLQSPGTVSPRYKLQPPSISPNSFLTNDQRLQTVALCSLAPNDSYVDMLSHINIL